MSKTLRAILAEIDQEFVYHIKSTRHLHDDETFYNLQLGMLGYDLRSMERVSYNPLKAVEPMFNPKNDAPGIDYVYHVRVILGTDVPNGILRQKVAYFTDINWEYIVVHRDGESLEDSVDVDVDADQDGGSYKNLAFTARTWEGTPDQGDVDTNAQQYVGSSRMDAFMKELEADRKDRLADIEARNVDPKLTEAFATTHLALRDVMGHAPRRGYYVIERHDAELNISGPFRNQPSNYPFVADMIVKGAGTYEILSDDKIRMAEASSRFRFTKPLREQQIPRPYEVMVKDQDTGKTYNVVVKALGETDARAAGVEQVAAQEQLDVNRLIAVEPTAVA